MELDISGNGHQLLPPADWAGEIQKLQDDLMNERDRNLRTLADFKNYRRRIERDGDKLADARKREVILSLLDIIDDMEKALPSSKDPEKSSVKGMRIIHQKFLAVLETHGVLPFNSIGTPFDHNLHEAVAMDEQDGSESGTVVEELRRGYRWNNELLRPAQVRVAGL